MPAKQFSRRAGPRILVIEARAVLLRPAPPTRPLGGCCCLQSGAWQRSKQHSQTRMGRGNPHIPVRRFRPLCENFKTVGQKPDFLVNILRYRARHMTGDAANPGCFQTVHEAVPCVRFSAAKSRESSGPHPPIPVEVLAFSFPNTCSIRGDAVYHDHR